MHVTNFKWQRQTAMEARLERKAEKRSAHDQCYFDVDARDGRICRVTGKFLYPGHSDPKQCLERHHMKKPRSSYDTPEHVITIRKFIHDQVTANKLHLSGDANLRGQDGKFCGVELSRMTEYGWSLEATL